MQQLGYGRRPPIGFWEANASHSSLHSFIPSSGHSGRQWANGLFENPRQCRWCSQWIARAALSAAERRPVVLSEQVKVGDRTPGRCQAYEAQQGGQTALAHVYTATAMPLPGLQARGDRKGCRATLRLSAAASHPALAPTARRLCWSFGPSSTGRPFTQNWLAASIAGSAGENSIGNARAIGVHAVSTPGLILLCAPQNTSLCGPACRRQAGFAC